MFKSGIPGILRDDVSEDGGSRTGVSLSGVPVPVYNGTSGPGALCDDLPDRNHEGHDHDHQQSRDPSGDGKLQSISEPASYVVCGGGFPVPVRYDASHGSRDELEDDPEPPCLTVLIVLSYATMDYRKIEKEEKKEAGEEHSQAAAPKEKFWFLKNTGFLLAVGALFFYMGLENSVNGWFVTYLKSTGFMSASLATVMVSVTWIMIMIGRIVIANVSKRVPPAKILAVISTLQFVAVLILVFANNTVMAVAALVLLGLGMAGAFPTTTAFTGDLMGNSPLGMSVFTGIGSLGGILTPQVIGVLADKLGFRAAILFLVLDALLLALFGIGALRYTAIQKK